MFARHLAIAIACLIFAVSAHGQPAATDAHMDGLIRKLGSSSFAQREQARMELEAIGPQALGRLRAHKASDAETSRRIAALTRLFEEQVLVKQILAPKEVTLSLKDADVRHAIKELAAASGYPIQFFGDATKFAQKKITIEGKLPFWQAFDKLCDQAGLIERVERTRQVLPDDARYDVRMLKQPTIVVVNRGSEKSFVSHAGAARTEIRITRVAGSTDLNVLFILSTEQRLLNVGLAGAPILDRAIDDKGRKLQPSLDTSNDEVKSRNEAIRDLMALVDASQNHRAVQVRLADHHAASKIKELAGKLMMQVDVQDEVLARLERVMDSAGKSATGLGGGTLKLQSIKKNADGSVAAQLTLENLGPDPFGNKIFRNAGGGIVIQGMQIQGGGGIVIGPNGVRVSTAGTGSVKDLPDLIDAKGQKFTRAKASDDTFNVVNDTRSRTVTVLYQPNPGQAEPSELVLYGTHTRTIGVPFRFENIPLP